MRRRPPGQKGLTLKECREMEYLSKVVDETLRYVSFSLVVFREAQMDVNLNGTSLSHLNWNNVIDGFIPLNICDISKFWFNYASRNNSKRPTLMWLVICTREDYKYISNLCLKVIRNIQEVVWDTKLVVIIVLWVIVICVWGAAYSSLVTNEKR